MKRSQVLTLVLLAGLVMFLVGIALTLSLATIRTNAESFIPTPMPTAESTATTLTITPDHTPTTTIPTYTPAPEWITYTIDLYGFTVSIPYGWTFREADRRPEREPIKGHDCANYVITSDNGMIRLDIINSCGMAEWYPIDCPADTMVIGEIPTNNPDWGNRYILRYYHQEHKKYVWTRSGEVQISSEGQVKRQAVCMNPPVITAGDGSSEISLQYWGSGDISDVLTLVDKIIVSIDTIP